MNIIYRASTPHLWTPCSPRSWANRIQQTQMEIIKRHCTFCFSHFICDVSSIKHEKEVNWRVLKKITNFAVSRSFDLTFLSLPSTDISQSCKSFKNPWKSWWKDETIPQKNYIMQKKNRERASKFHFWLIKKSFSFCIGSHMQDWIDEESKKQRERGTTAWSRPCLFEALAIGVGKAERREEKSRERRRY